MSFVTTCTASATSQNSQSDLIDIRNQCICPPTDVLQKFSSYADRIRAIRQTASERCCPTYTLVYADALLDVSGISGELFELNGGDPVGPRALFQVQPDLVSLLLFNDEPIYKVKPIEPYTVTSLLVSGIVRNLVPNPPNPTVILDWI